ncbi:hypothetical protein P8918_12785 [Bacillus spizizenii]|nr:hypothetical protein [Bacillus spizizenii]MCY8890445.1 hypothetical protein [Bacillus spizizenii]MEC0841900.1 hypothetical protein [Bacillus spizizenii]
MCVACQQQGHEKEHEGLLLCSDCHYVGNTGYWIGTVELQDGSTVSIEGHAYLEADGETFDLNSLLEQAEIETEDVAAFNGSANCPICDSENLY